MKTKKNILFAFLLNVSFSIFELIGGLFCGSVAITSDALHDFGDALSIGLSYFLEKKSEKMPDARYTYGYGRFSVLGGLITTCILIFGSIFVIIGAIYRIANPVKINYDGMIIFAVIGTAVNLTAAFLTHRGHSLNQRAVNLHMLEDALGWLTVLIGAIVMRFTDFALLDAIISLGVAVFILIHALKTLIEIGNLFLLKTPDFINIEDIRRYILELDGVYGVKSIRILALDEKNIYAMLCIYVTENNEETKVNIKKELLSFGITDTMVEFES